MNGWKSVRPQNPDYYKTPEPSPVQVREKDYKHNIVHTKDTPLNSIISHIEGSSWVVDYYSQMIGINQEPRPYDINASTVEQQYHFIAELELKLQDQSVDTDDKTNMVGVSGSAVIYAGIIPNVGDVILSDIGDGICGRHSVTRVTKKQYMKDTVYEIDYQLIEYMTSSARVDHLNGFVVKESVFTRDMMRYGSSPVLLKSDYNDYINAEDIIVELIDDWIREYYSNELGTIEVPGYGVRKTYDPYAIAAFKEVVDIDEHPLMRKLKTLNVNEIKEAYSFSIWPVLIDPSVNKIDNSWKRAGPVSFNRFNLNYVMNSFRYSGFNQCISPVEDLQNVDYYHGWAQQSKVGSLLSTYRMTTILSGSYGTAIGEQLAAELKNDNRVCCHHLVYYHEANPKAIPEGSKTWLDTVHLWLRATGHMSACKICGGCNECCDGCDDDCSNNGSTPPDPYEYVFPVSFWNGGLDNPYHSLVRRYLRGDHINLSEIFTQVRSRQLLTPKERFYKMLVLLIILKSTIRGL